MNLAQPCGFAAAVFLVQRGVAYQRGGPESNRRLRLCRPLPNHSVTAPGARV
jgi:hypothetical protein